MYMIAGRDRGRPSGVRTEVLIGEDVSEVVEEFLHLGMYVTCENGVFH